MSVCVSATCMNKIWALNVIKFSEITKISHSYTWLTDGRTDVRINRHIRAMLDEQIVKKESSYTFGHVDSQLAIDFDGSLKWRSKDAN
jgi:hypothetical protein